MTDKKSKLEQANKTKANPDDNKSVNTKKSKIGQFFEEYSKRRRCQYRTKKSTNNNDN